MAIRFRKSIKIIPGVRINIGKKGISTSVGPRGATVNLSKRGTRVTAGIPGTGISASHLYKSTNSKSRVKTTSVKQVHSRKYSAVEWAMSAFLVEFMAILFWVKQSGGVAFFAGIVAIGIPIILIIRWFSKRSEKIAELNTTKFALERAESMSIPHEPTPLCSAGLNEVEPHWVTIAKAHGAYVEPKSRTKGSTNKPIPPTSEKPIYEHAESDKHNLELMEECCEAGSAIYWSQVEGERLCAAPYYFERVAILRRKNKDFSGEIDICNQWKAIISDYRKQPMVISGRAARVHLSPRSLALLARYPKAKELLKKQKAADR